MVGGRLAGYRHRHHAGPHGHLRHDEEWGLFLATTGDRYLATSGDFFMATDNVRSCLINLSISKTLDMRSDGVRRIICGLLSK